MVEDQAGKHKQTMARVHLVFGRAHEGGYKYPQIISIVSSWWAARARNFVTVGCITISEGRNGTTGDL